MGEPAWYDAATVVAGVRFDRERGLGQTPLDHDVGHFGMTVLMRPSAYLMLANRLTVPRAGTHEHIGGMIRRGEPLSPAFLKVEWSERPSALPCVDGHEGRHRMGAIRDVVGNVPVPVHVFVRFKRHDFLTDARVARMRDGMFQQDRLLAVHGPLFSHARVSRRTLEGPVTPTFNETSGYVPFEPSEAAEEFLAESVRREGAGLTFGRARGIIEGLDQEGLDGYGDWFSEGETRRAKVLREMESLARQQGESTEVASLLGPVEEKPSFRP